MLTLLNSNPRTSSTVKYDFRKSLANDSLPRDKTQSVRLHEPSKRRTLTDPITGVELQDAENRPSLVDGNLTIYFVSDASRKIFKDMPFNHPFPRLPYPANDDTDRGG